jgi:hypothetical protein
MTFTRHFGFEAAAIYVGIQTIVYIFKACRSITHITKGIKFRFNVVMLSVMTPKEQL